MASCVYRLTPNALIMKTGFAAFPFSLFPYFSLLFFNVKKGKDSLLVFKIEYEIEYEKNIGS